MTRPLTREERELARSLLAADRPSARKFAATITDDPNGQFYVLEARRVFRGLLIALGINTGCTAAAGPCHPGYPPGSPSPSSQAAACDLVGCAECRDALTGRSDLAGPALLPQKEYEKQFRQLLVSAFLDQSEGSRP